MRSRLNIRAPLLPPAARRRGATRRHCSPASWAAEQRRSEPLDASCSVSFESGRSTTTTTASIEMRPQVGGGVVPASLPIIHLSLCGPILCVGASVHVRILARVGRLRDARANQMASGALVTPPLLSSGGRSLRATAEAGRDNWRAAPPSPPHLTHMAAGNNHHGRTGAAASEVH